MKRYIAALLLLAVAGCAAPPRDLSPRAARAAAMHDITTGHMRIYIAGTAAAYPVGVESRDKALVSSLPEDLSLPIGCTVPRAGEAVDFARVYNREIIRHLRDTTSR